MIVVIILYFYYWYFISSWNRVGILNWKWIQQFAVPIFMKILLVPINHMH